MVVDLWEDYDEDMLDAFYRKYMTQFGTSDEIEPLENWHKALSTEGRDDPDICDLHVLLPLLLSGEHKGHKGHKYIIGGLVFEYYPTTNCALVTYIIVNEKYFNKGIGTDLLRRALTILDQNAKTAGHISGCNATFLEVKFSSKIGQIEEAMSHLFLHNKGFKLVDFEYYQPPTSLKNPVSNCVCLTVLMTPRIPVEGDGPDSYHYIPSSLLRYFITTLWADECGLIGYQYQDDPKYLCMLAALDAEERFPCLDLPWTRARIFKNNMLITSSSSSSSSSTLELPLSLLSSSTLDAPPLVQN